MHLMKTPAFVAAMAKAIVKGYKSVVVPYTEAKLAAAGGGSVGSSYDTSDDADSDSGGESESESESESDSATSSRSDDATSSDDDAAPRARDKGKGVRERFEDKVARWVAERREPVTPLLPGGATAEFGVGKTPRVSEMLSDIAAIERKDVYKQI